MSMLETQGSSPPTSSQGSLWILVALLALIFLIFIWNKRYFFNLDCYCRHCTCCISKEYSGGKKKGKLQARNNTKGGGTTHEKPGHIGINICGENTRTFALEEVKFATKDFGIRIGVGATSYVYLAVFGDGRLGAVKRVMVDRGGSRKMFLHEASVLMRISHPNLVGLMGICFERGEQLLLLEYVPNKSLFDRMHTHRGQSSGILSWSKRLNIALDIAHALDYLHSHADPPIIHRDVKSSNILLTETDHAKLGDFGFCKLGNNGHVQGRSPVKGSYGYTDTNYLRTGQVCYKLDIYSFGVLLLELITGLKALIGSATLAEWTEKPRKNETLGVYYGMLDPKLNGDANADQLQTLMEIANMCLLENSESRPTMSQIINRLVYCMEPQLQPELPV
ncbi:hypothetical protein GIB67_038746 [Kingdonia uniflora]|uniref:non-specific serine/threonine protein kinase n=1 Tax=Kingdonia uniflora TaxID=39325 RepID=A0A7J7NSZ0_9MAGN|nr:hypothetical protein GIB67_038746 [Kingdonia uniflora]